MIIVTNHAIERYIERVERVTPEVARERLSSPTIQMNLPACRNAGSR
jgi:hypothetical protein